MTSHMTDITLNVAPHPFSLERVTHKVSAGLSIDALVQDVQPHALLRRYAHVLLDGHVIAPQDWARVYPKAGSVITVRMVPQGGRGGGKNPLQTVLSIAVLAASPVIASTLVGALGATGSFMGISAARLITGGVNLLGRLALNALAPPARPRYGFGQKDAPVYSIQAAQNRVEYFARVPKVLGRHRFVPPLGAMPYTETVGGDQYLRMLFVWGYGPLEIADLKIGETPLSEFEGVEVENRQGFADDAPLTLYSNAVLQNDLQVALKKSAGAVVRTSDADAEELSVDVTFARGLFKFGNGNAKHATSVDIEVQYAPAGTQEWSTGAVVPRAVEACSVAMLAAPEPYERAGVTSTVTRVDRVVMDAASAQVRVMQGQVFRPSVDSGSAVAPAVPEGVVSLASIVVSSHAVPVVTDERGLLPVTVKFAQPDDFKVTVSDGRIHVAAGALTYQPLLVTAKQSTTLRRAVSFKVAKGRYDVRLRRLTDDATSDNVFDECVWTALRTVRSTMPVRMQGLAMTALRIKATDQLNGIIDRFNGVVQALIPDWTGSEWRVQPTSNPASLYRHVLQGAGNNRPLEDMRMDMSRLLAWHERCRVHGYAFDAVVDYDTSVREVLQDIAATGRASPAIVDGKWSVVEDIAQTVPVQHFTPRNTFAFEAQKAFDEQPEALRVRFINRDKGWVADERLVFRDGFDETVAQKYETLELTGVTSADQAWKLGRYHLATAVLRPETYQFSADIEHLVCTRGDMVRLTHDVPMFGLSSARIVSCLAGEGGLSLRCSWIHR